jgi:hypothetical protein
MEASQYRLVLTGRVMAGFDAEDVIDRLATMLKVNTSKARAMLAGQPSVIRQGIDRETAQRFEAALKKGGIDARVEAQPPEKPQAPPVPAGRGPAAGPVPEMRSGAPGGRRSRPDARRVPLLRGHYRPLPPKPAVRRRRNPAAAGTADAQPRRWSGQGEVLHPHQDRRTAGPVCAGVLSVLLRIQPEPETVAVKQLPPAGGIIGPITVAKDRTTYHVKVKQPIRKSGHWATVSGEVLDANKKYLFGFGKEFWAESGRDSDGYWSESVTKYDMKVNLGKGTYYLGIATERHPGVTDGIQVKVQRKSGSGLPFTIAGIMAMLLGVALVTMENVKVSSG